MPQAGLEYVRKLRDVKYYETIFEILARQFEAAKLDEARQGAMIQVVDVAVPPDRRSFPKRGRFAVLGFVVGLVMGIGLALSAVGLDYLRSQEASNTRLILLRRTLSWRSRSAS